MFKKCKCCCSAWWSGFFGLAAIVHIVRLVLRAEVQIGTHSVPIMVSVAVAVIAGILSLFFCKKSCSACQCEKKA